MQHQRSGYAVGDRVVVPPYTRLLRAEAPGGPGVVVSIEGDADNPTLYVRLDSGIVRSPVAFFVEREEAGS